MADVHVWRLDLPEAGWPGGVVTMNQLRGQSRYLAQKTAPWREYGRLQAMLAMRHGRLPLPDGVRCWVEARHPDNRRRDTGNIMPTAKALVDGLVDAGVIRDDCDGIFEGPLLVRSYPNGPRRLRIILEVVGVEALRAEGARHGD